MKIIFVVLLILVLTACVEPKQRFQRPKNNIYTTQSFECGGVNGKIT